MNSKGHFEMTKSTSLKPRNILLTLHSSKEPANIRSNALKIPLGYSTLIFITPRARKIDENGKQLSETERECRIAEDVHKSSIFKSYTQEGCLLECKTKQSYEKCGCFPWNYLPTQVLFNIH